MTATPVVVAALVALVVAAGAVVVRFLRMCLDDLDAAPVVLVFSHDTWRALIIFFVPLGGLLYLACGRPPR